MAQETTELTYKALADGLAGIGSRYGDMDVGTIFGAFSRAGGIPLLNQWPAVQNRRVKGFNTLPNDISKNELAEMVTDPGSHERQLRAVSASLTGSTKTYDLIIQTYQDLLTYDWYIYPAYTANDPGIEAQKRDLYLCQNIVESMDLRQKAHEVTGLTVQYGKTFWTPRVSVDKSHNKVNHAFLQQLPEDWCKIVGYNDGPGKYTVAFDLMYFLRPGTDPRQFGDLFLPYMDAFYGVTDRDSARAVRGTDGKYVYSAKIDTEKFEQMNLNATEGNPEWVAVGRTFMYWVTLPAEKVLVFESSDRSANVVPTLTGLMVSMVQIPDYEAAQMQIVLNPLTSIMTGELETHDVKDGGPNADPIAVGPSVRRLFETYWYNMLEENNTSGVGLYLAPAKNLKLQTISDTVSNTNIATTAVSDQVQKAGLGALIPTTNDPKVGIAELSAMIQASFPKIIYRQFERFFNWLFDSLNLRTTVKLRMFGDIFSRKEELENARKGMTLGILADTLRYDAMTGHTILDDMAISDFVDKLGVLDKRIPLVTSYSAKQSESGLPPQAKQDLNPGGRPEEDGSQNGQKTEDPVFDR